MTPILLLLLLGAFVVGLALVTDMRLTHAAQEAAVVGARTQAVPQRCPNAIEAVTDIYGSTPDEVTCEQPGNVLEVTIADRAPAIPPFGAWTVRAVGRAVTTP